MVGMARGWIEDGLAEVIHLGSNGELHAAPPRRPAVFPPRASPPASHGICPNLSLSDGFAAREAFLLPGAIRVRCGDGGEIGRRRARNRTAVDPEDRTQRSPGGRSAPPGILSQESNCHVVFLPVLRLVHLFYAFGGVLALAM